MKVKVLWAVKKSNPDWQEELLTDKEERIEDAIKWAKANDFDRFRIADIDLNKPLFD